MSKELKYTVETTQDGWVETLEISVRPMQKTGRDVVMAHIGVKKEILLIVLLPMAMSRIIWKMSCMPLWTKSQTDWICII